jgi:hypothetical protein
MELPTAQPNGAGNAPPKSSAERLVAAMHAVCSHDLPNQILSLQSLINLIDMDAVIPAGAAGHEYLTRLKKVTEKTVAMSDFLKAMVRLASHTPQPCALTVHELFRELVAEAKSALDVPLAWDVRKLSGNVWADRDLVYSSLGDLLRALTAGGAKDIAVTSLPSFGRTVVVIGVSGPGLPTTTSMLEQRYDFLLARERLHVAGVNLKFGPTGVGRASVILDFAAERT